MGSILLHICVHEYTLVESKLILLIQVIPYIQSNLQNTNFSCFNKENNSQVSVTLMPLGHNYNQTHISYV